MIETKILKKPNHAHNRLSPRGLSIHIEVGDSSFVWMIKISQTCIHISLYIIVSNHNMDIGTMWHCALVSSAPSQFIGPLFCVFIVLVSAIMCSFYQFLDRVLFHHDGSDHYWDLYGHYYAPPPPPPPPPQLQWSSKGVYLFYVDRPSLRLSVRLWTKPCPLSIFTILAGSISYLHILSSNFRRCVVCKGYCKIPFFL